VFTFLRGFIEQRLKMQYAETFASILSQQRAKAKNNKSVQD